MRTPSRVPPLLVLALAVLLAAGCAGPAGDPVEAGDGAGVTGSTMPAPAVATTAGTKAPAVQPDDGPAAPLRVIATGRVAAGVEPGCLVLHSARGRTWLLVGGDRSNLTPGARVRVVGTRVAGRSGTCQQGEPLRVVGVQPAG